MRPRARGVGWHVLVARGFAEEHRSVGEWHEGPIKACPRGAEVGGEGVRFVVQLVVGDVLLVVVGIRDGAVGDARCRCARRVLRAVQSREPDVRREAEAGDRVYDRKYFSVTLDIIARMRRSAASGWVPCFSVNFVCAVGISSPWPGIARDTLGFSHRQFQPGTHQSRMPQTPSAQAAPLAR